MNTYERLGYVYDWLVINELSLNIEKTKYMIFHVMDKKINDQIPEIKFDNISIEGVSNFNFLELTLNANISWNHVSI